MKRNLFAVRITILIIILCLLHGSITAQSSGHRTVSIDQLNLYRDNAANMKTAGMIMTLAGLPVYLTGFFLLINYAIETPAEERGGFEPKLYTGMTIGGAISSVIGVNLWVAGSRKLKAEVAFKPFYINAASPMAVGLGITVRF